MARYIHKETTESGVVGYGVHIERPRPMVRTGGGVLVRPSRPRESFVEAACPEDLRRMLQGK